MNDPLALYRLLAGIVLTWLFWFVVFAGWGALFARACGRRVGSFGEFLDSFWSGWSLALIFLVWWHFFLPINAGAALAVIGVGLAGHAFARRLPPLWARRWGPRKIAFALVFAALAWLMANHSLMLPINFDTGLYHLPSIHWFRSYPVIPGLGNLHGRLAFNQSYFLYAALLDVGPWRGDAFHIVSGIFPIVLIAQLTLRLLSPLRPGEDATRRLFWLLLAVPALNEVNNFNISSPSPDMLIFVLSLVLAMEFLDLLLAPAAALRGLRWRVPRLVLLGMAGITVKLNFLVLGGATAALGVAVAAVRLARRQGARPALLLAGRSICLGVLILLPWMSRGVILSGYPLYPLHQVSVPVPWRVPKVAVLEEASVIHGFARDPFEEMRPWPIPDWRWFRVWALYTVEFSRFHAVLPIALVAFAFGVTLHQRRRGVVAANARSMALFMSLPCAALAFWFISAPHPRFAGGAFWILAAGANAFVLGRYGRERRRLMYGLAALIILFTSAFHGAFMGWIKPDPVHGFAPAPHPELKTFVTDSGLVLYVDSNRSYQCWDLPLPNTGYPKRGLQLIEPGNLRRGFMWKWTHYEKAA